MSSSRDIAFLVIRYRHGQFRREAAWTRVRVSIRVASGHQHRYPPRTFPNVRFRP